MTDQSPLVAYWNSRADNWGTYTSPLIPDEAELDFQRRYLKQGGSVLVLGATTELCALALEADCKVTAVDFAEDIIERLRIEGVNYRCDDWLDFFEQNDEQFDNIMSDGGLNCLEFPNGWQRVAEQVRSHLKPAGTFSPRIYINTLEAPRNDYINPNLNIFVPSMSGATPETDWTVYIKRDKHNARFVFPPRDEVERVFGHLALAGMLVPAYEEGGRFISFAWQPSAV